MSFLKQLWQDETGALFSAEYMMIGTIVLIGTVVGIKSVRDAVVTEFADYAAAIIEYEIVPGFPDYIDDIDDDLLDQSPGTPEGSP